MNRNEAQQTSGGEAGTDHLHPTVRQYFENARLAEEYDEFFSDIPLFLFDCQVLLRELKPGGRILDAGCGTGRHLIFLEKRGFEMHGLDLSQHFLRISRHKLEQHGLPVRLIHGDLMNPPIPDALRFDGIILMFSVLGMIRGSTNRIRALTTLRRFLSPEGKIVAHVHNRNYAASTVFDRLQRLKGLLGRPGSHEEGDRIMRNYRGIQDLYLHSFSREEIIDCFRRAELRIENILPLNDRRDGPCNEPVPSTAANGFIISATA